MRSDVPLMSSCTYLFSKKIEHCGALCACMEGVVCVRRNGSRFRFGLQRVEYVCVALCSCERVSLLCNIMNRICVFLYALS